MINCEWEFYNPEGQLADDYIGIQYNYDYATIILPQDANSTSTLTTMSFLYFNNFIEAKHSIFHVIESWKSYFHSINIEAKSV